MDRKSWLPFAVIGDIVIKRKTKERVTVVSIGDGASRAMHIDTVLRFSDGTEGLPKDIWPAGFIEREEDK